MRDYAFCFCSFFTKRKWAEDAEQITHILDKSYEIGFIFGRRYKLVPNWNKVIISIYLQFADVPTYADNAVSACPPLKERTTSARKYHR